MSFAVGFFNRLQLSRQNLIARNAGPRHHHNECHVRITRGHHRCDDSSFTVADQTNLVRIDLGLGFQVRDGGFGVGGKIRCSRGLEVAAGLSRSPVVGPQHRNPSAREVVGKNQERLVSHQAFVPILRARPCDQDHCRKRPLPLRNGESRGQRDILNFVLVRHFFIPVGVRLGWVLRPLPLQFRLIFYAA